MKTRHDMVIVFVARPAAEGSHEFLQLRRAGGMYMGETWQTVSGGVEAGETAVAAALRELREETGLAPAEFYRLPSIHSFYTVPHDTVWHAPVFFALVAAGAAVALNDEHTDHRWVATDEVDSAFMWPGDRALIGEIRREILGDGMSKPHLHIKL